MANSVDFSGRPFHFIGVGGIGMSAIAYVLAKQKIPVSGSDAKLNGITLRLEAEGVHIFQEQHASNLEAFSSSRIPQLSQVLSSDTEASSREAGLSSAHALTVAASPHDVGNDAGHDAGDPGIIKKSLKDETVIPQVVCSTAINSSNPEYRAALDMGCPIFHRSDILAALMHNYQSIAVGGTHGKTTTSSMIGHVLLKTDVDPTILVGGEVDAWGGNARLGLGNYLVAEADESDGSLVKFFPDVAIITNIELDHPDHYSTLDDVIAIFETFVRQSQTFIGCVDCPTVRQRLWPDISYALNSDLGADYTVRNTSSTATHTTAEIIERGQCLGTVRLPMLGDHNLNNALAAIAVARHLELEFDAIAAALESFGGAHRRFERRGEYCNITFVDDYAHHPSELKATLSAAKLQVQSSDGQYRRVVAVFQPHRYSRTYTFLQEFGKAFSDADAVVTTDIYSAGEINEWDVSGQRLADVIAQSHSQVTYQPSLSEVEVFLQNTLKSGDLVLFLGAGNLNTIIPSLLTFYWEKEQHTLPSSICNPA
ncbi:MAG: UDP-N-acetylmuramate--L-alanine ligase [Elainellaceae cyanobacterium]